MREIASKFLFLTTWASFSLLLPHPDPRQLITTHSHPITPSESVSHAKNGLNQLLVGLWLFADCILFHSSSEATQTAAPRIKASSSSQRMADEIFAHVFRRKRRRDHQRRKEMPNWKQRKANKERKTEDGIDDDLHCHQVLSVSEKIGEERMQVKRGEKGVLFSCDSFHFRNASELSDWVISSILSSHHTSHSEGTGKQLSPLWLLVSFIPHLASIMELGKKEVEPLSRTIRSVLHLMTGVEVVHERR